MKDLISTLWETPEKGDGLRLRTLASSCHDSRLWRRVLAEANEITATRDSPTNHDRHHVRYTKFWGNRYRIRAGLEMDICPVANLQLSGLQRRCCKVLHV